MTRFHINRTENAGGPSIFGARLRSAIVAAGWRWDPWLPSVNFVFSAGLFRPFCRNVVRFDGLYFDSGHTLGRNESLNRPIRRAYAKADAAIYQSGFCQRLFHEFFGVLDRPEAVILNGAPNAFADVEAIDHGFAKTLICSAEWRAHKRLGCIIDGFLEYGEPGVGLVVLGETPAAERREHPNIRYPGRVAIETLPRHLKGADAFIHLCWLDSCPNTVVEALTCGLPVLCSHNGGTKEIVGDNGIILRCEEDYAFTEVDLYNPPRCDATLLAGGIERILAWDKPVRAPTLNIDHVARRYMDAATAQSA